MTALIDLTGKRFGRLTVLARTTNNGIYVRWRCVCDCGGRKIAEGRNLRDGMTKSCGCLDTQHRLYGNVTHGMGSRRLGIYQTWADARQRCTNPNIKAYPNYGGSGIRVCARWDTFENFLEDMYSGWRPGMCLDRIDSEGDYEPSNCQWLTRSENAIKQAEDAKNRKL